MQRETLLQR